MSNELRTFAYICPECRQMVIAQRGSFALAAGDCEIPCPCGKSTLRVENMGSMYHLSVPCVAMRSPVPRRPCCDGRRWP